MRRWGSVAIAATLALLAGGLSGFAIGRRDSTLGRPDAPDPQRLRVAAWVQDWKTGEPEVELDVSPSGDGSECSSGHPCSITGARARVEAMAPTMTSDIVVSVSGGEYSMSPPLELGPQDSGQNGHRVIYRAAPGQTPVLSAGSVLTGWQPAAAPAGAFSSRIPAGRAARQLYVNGRRATRARGAKQPAGWSRTDQGFLSPDAAMASWRDRTDAEVVSFSEWRSFRCPVATVQGREVGLAQPCWRNATYARPFPMQDVGWVENALELLDEPGEWYLDRLSNQILYMPRPGEDLSTADVRLPAVDAVVVLGGTADDPVHDLAIEGLTFSYSAWQDPSGPGGYVAAQAGWHRGGSSGADPLDNDRTPGAVRISHARHVRITGNNFCHLGGTGLDVAAGGQDLGIIGNRFCDISSSAIQVGEARQGAQNPTPADQLDRIQIADNLIDTVAVEYPDAIGIFVSYGSNVSILHNELSHLPYTGISLGWGWGTDSYARSNLVLGNRLTDVVSTLSDGGAIYTLSAMPQTVIERNYVSGQRNRSGALFLDEGSAGITVADNVVEGSPRWLHIWTASAHDNTIVDNFSDTGGELDAGTRDIEARNHTASSGWPPEAAAIVSEAGLEPAFADLRRR